VYLSLPLVSANVESPEALLKPYLNAILALTISPEAASTAEPLFAVYYNQQPIQAATTCHATQFSDLLVPPSLSGDLASSPDAASLAAEALFFKAVDAIKSKRPSAWALNEGNPTLGSGSDIFEEIKALWPPLDSNPDEETDD
jgi:Rab proteins geranylgeranyltransferase component A